MKIKRECIYVGVINYLLTVFIGASDFEQIQGRHQFLVDFWTQLRGSACKTIWFSRVDAAFHPSEVDQMSTEISRGLSR